MLRMTRLTSRRKIDAPTKSSKQKGGPMDRPF
jgi:hypothetical protein